MLTMIDNRSGVQIAASVLEEYTPDVQITVGK